MPSLKRLRQRRLAVLATLASTKLTPAQLAATKTELEQIDQQLRDLGESGLLTIAQTDQEAMTP
jgi:hypothetical protein